MAPAGSRSLLRASARQRLALALGGVGVAVGFVVWPGCATPPLPGSRTPVGSVRKSDLKFPKQPPPTREEIIAKLGKPDFVHDDLGVVVYRLNEVTRKRLWLLFGVLPVGVDSDTPGLEVAMLRFDGRGQLLGHVRRTVRGQYSLIGGLRDVRDFHSLTHQAAVEWSKGQPSR